ncbi:DUF397 domain-containing protein [Streptomycetaceae bacterium NBC_01309]
MNTNVRWRKSSYSANDQECVEVAPVDGRAGLRDSKWAEQGHLDISAASWVELVRVLRG